MANLMFVSRKTILMVCCLFMFSAVALALGIRTRSRTLQDSNPREKERTLKQIERAPEQSLKILGNDDCPLKLTEARVKEIPGVLFTKLTGKTTNLETVISVPEVRLVNVSGRTVNKFFLFVRNPEAHFTRGVGRTVSLKPGEVYTVERSYFAAPEKTTTMGANGQAEEKLITLGMDSEKMWLNKGARPDLYVTVARIEFEDGSNWTLNEGGEVR
jgi:hypothetical protein